MSKILSDTVILTEAWKEIGFTSDQIKNLLSMERISTNNLNLLSCYTPDLEKETENTKAFEQYLISKSSKSPTIYSLASTNGNPPEDPADQAERMVHVYNDAYTLYGDQANVERYVVYLYLSHYVDNPRYSKSSPNFDTIFADVLTDNDISSFETFITSTNFSGIANDIVNFSSSAYSLVSTGSDITGAVGDIVNRGKIIILNTVNSLLDLYGSIEDVKGVTSAIYNTIYNTYSSGASAETMIQTINNTLGTEQINQVMSDYIGLCTTGLMSVLAATPSLVGYGISMTVFYYDFCSSILNRARLAALQYSHSGRVALRLDKVLSGG